MPSRTDAPDFVFEDFVLRIARASSNPGYQAWVERSPYGSCPPIALDLPLLDRNLDTLLRSLEKTIRGSGQTDSPLNRDLRPSRPGQEADCMEPPDLGAVLFDALFSGPIRERFLNCLALVGSHPNRGLRLRLKFDPQSAEPIGSLPWELLYRFETRDFLSRNIRNPVIRHLDVNRPMLTPLPLSRLRILVVLSQPEGVARLNVEGERTLLEKALGERADIDLRVLKRPTLTELRSQVRNEPFDVLHFIGHGGFDKGKGILVFEDPDNQASIVTGSTLADNLKGFEPIRLVFLNACETARFPRAAQGRDPYQGVASSLIIAGVPAVIAMQFPITDGAATLFSGAFYRALAQGDSVENAVVEGRLEVARKKPSSWEWATPVLFLGVPHGDIFRADGRRQAEEAAVPIPDKPSSALPSEPNRETHGEAIKQALELLDFERYEEAVEVLNDLKAKRPKDAEIFYYLGLARLHGRRPRSLRPDVIKRVEADLWTAGNLSRGREPAHLWLLQALIKHDFYRLNGLRVKAPTVEELLTEARTAALDPSELQRLDSHEPSRPNPVRQLISELLNRSRLQ